MVGAESNIIAEPENTTPESKVDELLPQVKNEPKIEESTSQSSLEIFIKGLMIIFRRYLCYKLTQMHHGQIARI